MRAGGRLGTQAFHTATHLRALASHWPRPARVNAGIAVTALGTALVGRAPRA